MDIKVGKIFISEFDIIMINGIVGNTVFYSVTNIDPEIPMYNMVATYNEMKEILEDYWED